MRVHHLNCSTMCPRIPRRFLNPAGKLVCHCLLVETGAGLCLVDTGFGAADLAAPQTRIGGPFLSFARLQMDPDAPAVAQVQALGFSPRDVRHVVVTHLDLDHAGGLSDFPWARVHCYAPEHRAAMSPTFAERQRYRASQWAHGPDWATYETRGERFYGFECVRSLDGLPEEILLVPLGGHSRGHAGVAVRGDDGWLLHCGDAYFFGGEMDPRGRRCTPGLELFQRMMAVDNAARLSNQQRLRELARDHGDEITLFCAHDPGELAAQQARRRAA